MFTTALSSLEISVQIAFCEVMSSYRDTRQEVPVYDLGEPHLRICDSELDKKAYAVTKFSSRVIEACIRWLREDRQVF
jgi:hypothetical protein